MDSVRFILIVSLSLVSMLLWDAWQRDYGKLSNADAQSTEITDTAADVPAYADTITPRPESTGESTVGEHETTYTLETDALRLKVSHRGGTLISAELLNYPVSLDDPTVKTRLLQEDGNNPYFVQGGLLSKQPAPAHDAVYIAGTDHFALEPAQDMLEVPLVWSGAEGVEVRKIYELRRGSYLINVRYEINNGSGQTWTGRAYGQIQRTKPGNGMNMVHTYTGAVLSSEEERYKKVSFDDIKDENLDVNVPDGWVAMIQHYFISALLPADNAPHRYYTLYLDSGRSQATAERYIIGMTTPQVSVAPGANISINHKLYLGPKLQNQLETIAPGLELTVDYGIFWFIAKPLFWCLGLFHDYTGNWGWAIILVTLMLKIIFYRLSAAGYRSMANMRRVQPKLLAIKDRYKNDRARLNQAMMELYKNEKINPLGGCFPILIQIPVFIALYWVLLESVEMRQVPFILWIKDLSSPDPWFVLPLVMGVTMWVQQKLNPAPMDPVQEKVMQVLPFVFTVFFAFFPSGLVLYWVVNNILSIAQQWLIIRNLERAGLRS